MARRLAIILLAAALPCSGRECGEPEIIAQDITGCTSVEHVKHLGHKSAIWLGDQLHHNPHLETLDLHHTHIGDDDAVSLAAGLHNNTYLKRLAMHNNQIRDVGAAALGNALAHNDALEHLQLSSNGVADKGAIGLAEGLRNNRALRRLDLYFNSVGDAGAAALAKALEVNTGLRMLHLDTNAIGEGGGLALANTIRGGKSAEGAGGVRSWLGGGAAAPEVPRSLGELTLMYNHLSNAACALLMDAAVANPYVHTLNVAHNHDVHGAVKARMHDEHAPRMEARLAVATWVVERGLLGASVPDGFTDASGPPLATVYAPVVETLAVHTKEGRQKLRGNDAMALMARPELAAMADPLKRAELAHAILVAVREDMTTNHDEL